MGVAGPSKQAFKVFGKDVRVGPGDPVLRGSGSQWEAGNLQAEEVKELKLSCHNGYI